MKHLIELVGGPLDGMRVEYEPGKLFCVPSDETYEPRPGEPDRLESLPEARVRRLHYQPKEKP